MKNPHPDGHRFFMARGRGFEPQLLGPEPSVLPLDDPRMFCCATIVGIIR